MTMLLEASEEGIGGSWDGGKIVWSVRYTLEGEEENGSQLTGADQLQQRMQQRQLQHHHHHHVERRKLQARLEIQKDDIQAVLPISKVIRDSFADINVNSMFMHASEKIGIECRAAMRIFCIRRELFSLSIFLPPTSIKTLNEIAKHEKCPRTLLRRYVCTCKNISFFTSLFNGRSSNQLFS